MVLRKRVKKDKRNLKLLRNKEDFKVGDLRSDLRVINTWKGRRVRHFKGKEYLVIDVAWHTENGNTL